MNLDAFMVATDRPQRYGAIATLIATFMFCLGVSACGEAGDRDGESGDSAAIQTRQETIDTPSIPLRDAGAGAATGASGVTTPEPEARKQMQEKFDVMGGMEGVIITFDGPNAVVLEGTVQTGDRKQTAEDVARAVPGITKVENRIQVAR